MRSLQRGGGGVAEGSVRGLSADLRAFGDRLRRRGSIVWHRRSRPPEQPASPSPGAGEYLVWLGVFNALFTVKHMHRIPACSVNRKT